MREWAILQFVCPFNNERFVQIRSERDYRATWREAEDRPDVPADLRGTESPSLVELDADDARGYGSRTGRLSAATVTTQTWPSHPHPSS